MWVLSTTTNSNTDKITWPSYSVTDLAAMKCMPILTTTHNTVKMEDPSFSNNSSSSLYLVVTASCTGERLFSQYANIATSDTTASSNK